MTRAEIIEGLAFVAAAKAAAGDLCKLDSSHEPSDVEQAITLNALVQVALMGLTTPNALTIN